jgi:endonuclease YncB( thermonuclease family)
MRNWYLLAVGFICLCAAVAHAEWQGRVVSVYDADTLVVSNEGRGEIVRLAGVDAPEREQPFGLKAKKFAANMVEGKVVRIVPHGDLDNYRVYLGELCLNEELLREGYAWYNPRLGADEKYAALEMTARSARRGLWEEENPTPPWRYRKEGSEEASEQSPVSIKLPGVHGSPGGGDGSDEGPEQPARDEGAPPAPAPKAPPPAPAPRTPPPSK